MARSDSSARSLSGPVLLAILSVLLGAGIAAWFWQGPTSPAPYDDPAADRPGQPERLRGDPRRGEGGNDTGGGASLGVAGSVVDHDRRPISGAQVCASLRSGRGLTQAQRLRRPCTRSDEAGRFSLSALPAARFEVGASARGYIGTTVQVRASPDPGETPLELTLWPGGVPVRGQVLDLTGGELPGAWVTAGQPSIGTVSDDSGHFELWTAPGSLYLVASAPDYVPGGHGVSAPAEGVELRLAPASSLFGVVINADGGSPIAGVEVSAYLRDNMYNMAYGAAYGGTTVTDDAGEFTIDGLAAGRFALSVDDEEFFGVHPGTIGVRLGGPVGPVELQVRPRLGARIAGRVIDEASGEAPGECSLEFHPVDLAGGDQGWVETEVDGRFHGRLPPGEYRPKLNIFCATHVLDPETAPLIVEGADRENLLFRARRAASIGGTVRDQQGAPFARASVQLKGEAIFRGGQSGPGGDFRFEGLAPGDYELRVSADAAMGELPPRTIAVASGAQIEDVDVELARGTAVAGRIVDATGLAVRGAQIRAVGDQTRQTTSQDDGRFLLEGLAPGSYRLGARTADAGELARTGSGDTVLASLDIEPGGRDRDGLELRVERSTGSVRGVVVDDEGPVYDAYVTATRERAESGGGSNRVPWRELRPVLTEVDGSFEIDRLPAGSYRVRARRRDGSEGYVEGVKTGSEVTVRVELGGRLEGTASAADGTPLEDFHVRMVVPGREGFRHERFVGTGGDWAVRDLHPGTWKVTLEGLGRKTERSVTLGADETKTLALQLEPGVRLTGVVVDAETGEAVAQAWVSSPGAPRPTRSDASGRFTLDEVSPGETRIRARTGGAFSEPGPFHPGERALTVGRGAAQTVPPIRLVRRKLAASRNPGDLGLTLGEGSDVGEATAVASVRPGGPADDAGLRAGDVIVAVDGLAVEGDLTVLRAALQVAPGEAISVSVKGADAPVSIVAGPPR